MSALSDAVAHLQQYVVGIRAYPTVQDIQTVLEALAEAEESITYLEDHS